MGLDFSKAASLKQNPAVPDQAPQVVTVTAEPKGQPVIEVKEEVAKYDIVADREQMTNALVNSAEVDALVSTIEVTDMDTIVSFGAEAADEISKVSDLVLRNVNAQQMSNTNTMMNTLAKIMSKFDIKEIKDEPRGLGKVFRGARDSLERMLAKYHTMGDEVDKIYVELRKYETEIKESNRNLDSMFEANVNYYHELVKYILAGEQATQEVQNYIDKRVADMEATGDNSIQFEIQSLQQAKMLLEQRTQDLRCAESVAMQSIPMIKTMEFSNMNLVRKINSAFIVTLPVFKQALAQAIMLKQQKVMAEGMAALDEKTNEMLLKNAQNTVNQAKMTTQLASSSSIKAETLETTWRTIVNGIEETRRVQDDASKKRIEDKTRLENIKNDFNRMYHVPQKKLT